MTQAAMMCAGLRALRAADELAGDDAGAIADAIEYGRGKSYGDGYELHAFADGSMAILSGDEMRALVVRRAADRRDAPGWTLADAIEYMRR